MSLIAARNKFPCGRKKISLREEINFHTGENKFIYGRKFTGIREKINFLAGENSTGRRATSTIM